MASDDLRETLLQMVKVLEKGIAMEMNASEFYAAAAKRTDSPQGKMMFEWLSQFEMGHKARLEAKKRDLLAHESLRGVKPPELGVYDVSEAHEPPYLPENPTDVDVLKAAIGNEKKAYAFYQRKLTYSGDPSLKAMFDTMAREEEKHIKILREQLGHLEVNRMWREMENLEKEIRRFKED